MKGEAVGVSGGGATEVAATICHQDGYLLTAVPIVACLLQYLDGTIHKPGLWLMGLTVDPKRLVQDMERMGVQVRVEEKRPEREVRASG